MEYFKWADYDKHEVGNIECDTCWTDADKCECGGIVHNEFLDESYDGYFLTYQCDKCEDEYIIKES